MGNGDQNGYGANRGDAIQGTTANHTQSPSTLTNSSSSPLPSMTPTRVKLNVGGRTFQTTLSTLRAFPDSMIARMFDPANSALVHVDERDGAVFLDRDGDLFAVVLNFCRSKRLVCPPTIHPASIRQELDFFGLSEYVSPSDLEESHPLTSRPSHPTNTTLPSAWLTSAPPHLTHSHVSRLLTHGLATFEKAYRTDTTTFTITISARTGRIENVTPPSLWEESEDQAFWEDFAFSFVSFGDEFMGLWRDVWRKAWLKPAGWMGVVHEDEGWKQVARPMAVKTSDPLGRELMTTFEAASSVSSMSATTSLTGSGRWTSDGLPFKVGLVYDEEGFVRTMQARGVSGPFHTDSVKLKFFKGWKLEWNLPLEMTIHHPPPFVPIAVVAGGSLIP